MTVAFRRGDLQQVGAGDSDAALAEDLCSAAQSSVDLCFRPLIKIDHT